MKYKKLGLGIAVLTACSFAIGIYIGEELNSRMEPAPKDIVKRCRECFTVMLPRETECKECIK